MIAEDQNLIVRFAKTQADIERAQSLRYRVFVTELGAQASDEEHRLGREIDAFDNFAHHLLLIDTQQKDDHPDGAVVGVYRLIDEVQSRELGQYYSQSEYDISRLMAAEGKKLELGRSCLDVDYRGGAAMAMLWQALGRYVVDQDIRFLFGTASFYGTQIEGKRHALSNLYYNHLAAPELRPQVRENGAVAMNILPADKVDRLYAMRETPALIKAYLRLGGMIGDGAYRDNDFNTTDVFVLMQTDNLAERNKRLYSK